MRSSELDHHRAGCEALQARQQAVVAARGPRRVVAALDDALSVVSVWGCLLLAGGCANAGPQALAPMHVGVILTGSLREPGDDAAVHAGPWLLAVCRKAALAAGQR